MADDREPRSHQQDEETEQEPDDSGSDNTTGAGVADIAEEEPVDQQIVPFLGDDLAAAMTAAGAIYITLPGMCAALGLNVRGQTQRIQRTRSLSHALRRIPIETRGGLQRINCLRIDKLALWLAGVQTKQIKPPFREKIEAYQEELAPLATQVFMRVLGIKTAHLAPTTATSSASPEVQALAEQIDELSDIVAFLREHLAALLAMPGQVEGLATRLDTAVALLESLTTRQQTTETQVAQIDARTQRLTPAHARAVQEQVNHIVRQTADLPSPLTYVIIYGRLKHRFRAGSYSEIPDERYEAVMAFLRDELHRATGGDVGPEQGSLF